MNDERLDLFSTFDGDSRKASLNLSAGEATIVSAELAPSNAAGANGGGANAGENAIGNGKESSPTNTRWRRLEAALERASEWLNPILVKEARQAMKSRQFAVTFGLLLIFGWGWTLLGTAMMSPSIYYSAAGYAMLIGYYLILAFPLIVIVPFSAYRSLAAEREDGTYELLSITTLRARQIIGGKLGSSILQILVYFSALSPCMAFTYLLRGVDILTIGLILTYTFLGSVGLSAISLLLATVSRARHWQALWMVLLILGLFGLFIIASQGVALFLLQSEGVAFDDPIVWIMQATLLTAYVTYLALVLLAATARIDFASENRSTRLRVAMVLQQAVFVGWMSWFWFVTQESEVFYAYFMLAGLHWGVIAPLLVGESPEISQRVKRSLPRSFLGRVFLTWYNPGPGAGYMFAIANLFTLVLIGFLSAWVTNWQGFRGAPDEVGPFLFGFLVFCYLTAYVGLTRLLMIPLHRYFRPGPMGSLMLASVLAVFGCLIPMIIQFSLYQYMGDDYLILQAPNFIWTLGEVIESRGFLATDFPTVVLVFASAVLMFGANLFATAAEVRRVRQAVPQRILLDEAALHPERFIQPVVKSPFDE